MKGRACLTEICRYQYLWILASTSAECHQDRCAKDQPGSVSKIDRSSLIPFSIQEPQEAETAAASARAAAPRVAPRSAAVNLSGQQLMCVPAELWDSAACLTHLDLSKNQLSDLLAERLAGCAQLKVRTAAPTSNTFHASEVPGKHFSLKRSMWLGCESFKWGGNCLFASHALACKGVPEQGAEADQEPLERPLITEST